MKPFVGVSGVGRDGLRKVSEFSTKYEASLCSKSAFSSFASFGHPDA